MTKEFYDRLKAPFKEDPKKLNTLSFLGKLTTGIIYVGYPVMLFALFMQKDPLLYRAILVPAISFAIVTVIRHLLNSPRPYEVFDEPPLITRHGNGQSMPSRHVFSCFIIAFTAFVVNAPLGIIFFIIGAAIAAIRVVGGVHFVKDVIVGAACAIAAGIIGFLII